MRKQKVNRANLKRKIINFIGSRSKRSGQLFLWQNRAKFYRRSSAKVQYQSKENSADTWRRGALLSSRWRSQRFNLEFPSGDRCSNAMNCLGKNCEGGSPPRLRARSYGHYTTNRSERAGVERPENANKIFDIWFQRKISFERILFKLQCNKVTQSAAPNPRIRWLNGIRMAFAVCGPVGHTPGVGGAHLYLVYAVESTVRVSRIYSAWQTTEKEREIQVTNRDNIAKFVWVLPMPSLSFD